MVELGGSGIDKNGESVTAGANPRVRSLNHIARKKCIHEIKLGTRELHVREEDGGD